MIMVLMKIDVSKDFFVLDRIQQTISSLPGKAGGL
jgi:hypothetical protein